MDPEPFTTRLPFEGRLPPPRRWSAPRPFNAPQENTAPRPLGRILRLGVPDTAMVETAAYVLRRDSGLWMPAGPARKGSETGC